MKIVGYETGHIETEQRKKVGMFQESIIASHRQEVFLLKSIGRFLVLFSIRLPNYVRTQKSPGTVAEAPRKRQRQPRNGTTQIDKLIEASERQP